MSIEPYETLSDDDKLNLARDRLRGLESDHYRLKIAGDNVEYLEEKIELVRDEIERLEQAG